MVYRHPAAIAHDLKRWMRPDAYRFIRPGWRRYVRPESEAAAIFGRYEAKYRTDQPRVPAGVRQGGQWTDDGGRGGSGGAGAGGGATEVSAASRKAGGHHFVPKGVSSKYPLSAEARRVFDERTTGSLREPTSNRYDKEHRAYNDAVGESLDRFLNEKKIDRAQMTKQQAAEFVDGVIHSRDPRIRWLNMRIFMREIMFNLRRPRAGE